MNRTTLPGVAAGQPAAVLWTGGKDSMLALLAARDRGLDVRCLATFAPASAEFRAHPLPVMRLQAEATGLPHHVLQVDAPFDRGYEHALRRLRELAGIESVVSGDIAEVDGQPNWIDARSRAVGIRSLAPLWGRDRARLLQRMLDTGVRACVSCVDAGSMDPGWVGRDLDAAAVDELLARGSGGELDPCGENGEYHTLVVDSPAFARRVELDCGPRRRHGTLVYLDIRAARLVDKTA